MKNDIVPMKIDIDAVKAEVSSKTIDEFVKVLEQSIKDIDSNLVPLLRVYLNDVRDIRMALAREIKEILASSREMSELHKKTVEIREFTAAILLLEQTLTPTMVETLKKVTGGK